MDRGITASSRARPSGCADGPPACGWCRPVPTRRARTREAGLRATRPPGGAQPPHVLGRLTTHHGPAGEPPERRPAHLVLHPDVHRRGPGGLVDRVDRRAQDDRADRASVQFPCLDPREERPHGTRQAAPDLPGDVRDERVAARRRIRARRVGYGVRRRGGVVARHAGAPARRRAVPGVPLRRVLLEVVQEPRLAVDHRLPAADEHRVRVTLLHDPHPRRRQRREVLVEDERGRVRSRRGRADGQGLGSGVGERSGGSQRHEAGLSSGQPMVTAAWSPRRYLWGQPSVRGCGPFGQPPAYSGSDRFPAGR